MKRALVRLVAWFFVALTRFTGYVYVSEVISLIPSRLGEQVRYAFYRRTLAACGEDVTVHFGTILSHRDITIGDHVRLGTYNTFGHVDIGDYTLTAPGCQVTGTAKGHGVDDPETPIMLQPTTLGRVRLGPDVWLGAKAIVLANVGRGCVVGAGSVVTREVPDWAIVAGNPARVLRFRKGPTDAGG